MMKKFDAPRRGLLALLFLLSLSAPALAQPEAVSPPKQATQSSILAPIAVQLQSILPGATPAPASTSAPAPAGSQTPAASSATSADNGEVAPTETFGTKALNFMINQAEVLHDESDTVFTDFTALPQFMAWFNLQKTQPRLTYWTTTADDFVAVVMPSFLGALLLDFLFIPIRNSLRRRRPSNLVRKIGTLFAVIILRLIPVCVFVGVSLTLINQNEAHKFPRFIILNIVYALTLGRILTIAARALFAPGAESLRFLKVSNRQAVNACHWINAYGFFIIYGYFLIDVARSIRVPATAIIAFGNCLGLVLAIMTLIAIARNRSTVAIFLRGNLSAATPDLTTAESLRLWFARRWHVLAMTYIVLGYLITVLGVANGFTLMLRGTILTLIILVIMRLLLQSTDRIGLQDTTAGAALHHTILRMLLRFVIWGVAILASMASWGFNIPALFATTIGQRVMGAAFSIGTTVGIIALIYGAFNAAIERRLNRRDADGKALQASARMRTLLPMLRNTVFILFAIIIGMVVLSEIGFNIGPLLAGAGIFGVALGFGSQTLVKDFLTGLFIVVENTIAIGDVVKIGDHAGVVDAMSIRTLRLRDMDGALHILPFSEVTSIINMTKDYAFAVVDASVAYDSDLDHVMAVIRAVGEELQNDPIFKRVILEPVEVFGVETLGDSSITIRARLRTRPGKQWDVKRMFLLKLKQRFDKEGIEIPFPTVTQIHKPVQGQ